MKNIKQLSKQILGIWIGVVTMMMVLPACSQSPLVPELTFKTFSHPTQNYQVDVVEEWSASVYEKLFVNPLDPNEIFLIGFPPSITYSSKEQFYNNFQSNNEVISSCLP